MFEFTKSNKNRKSNPDKKKKFLEIKSFSISKFISSIIHKISYFDLLIIITVAFVLLFLLYSRFQRKSQWIDIRVSVENVDWWYQGSPPRYWYASDLKNGDIAKSSFGKDIAEVIKVDNYDIGGPYRNIYVDLKLKVVYDKNRNQFLYEFKPLTVGSSVIINFSNQQIRGIVTKIGGNNIDYSYKIIKIQRKSYQNVTTTNSNASTAVNNVNKPITPEMANKINVGDKLFDNNNSLIAEVLDVKNDVSSYYEFSDNRAQNIKTYNPYYRDLEVTLRVKTYKEMNLEFFINQAAIKIGSKIWIPFPEYSLEDFEIIDIIE